MRKFRTVLFSVLCVVLAGMFGTGVFCATYLSLNIGGKILYSTTDIGAKVWATMTYKTEGQSAESGYVPLSGAGVSFDYVYNVTTEEQNYKSITADVGSVKFVASSDTLEFFIFIKNTGSRYILPDIDVEITNTSFLTGSQTIYYFDVSAVADPLTTKQNSSSAASFVSSIATQIANGDYSSWTSNSSIDNEDVYCAYVVLGVNSSYNFNEETSIDGLFSITINFMADIQYTSDNILSVYQSQTSSDAGTTWTKYGVNATLSATATKVSSSSLDALKGYLTTTDSNGNASITYGTDDYQTAVVYKDIDLVNIDLETGELIGWLSDINYDFEWFGGSVTLPAGTTLASGRTLTASTTFNRVDVYTYYPTMYIRRWMVGDKQWMSVSDTYFEGSVEIEEYYIATFETTLFNANGTVASVNGKLVPRSYVYNRAPVTSGGASYLQTQYFYSTVDQDGKSVSATDSTTQANYLTWCQNLTSAWSSSSLASTYRKVTGIQGENWHTFVYNILYTIKYANNNSQETVGYGNVHTYNSAYHTSGTTVSTPNTITNKLADLDTYASGEWSDYACFESEKGGGVIGVYSSEKGTATYSVTSQTAETGYTMSATGFNNAGMNYGYNVTTFTNGNGVSQTGIYTQDYLVYNTGSTRYLLDGYVGTDGYTSVFCLGQANPWGNVWTWVFGSAAIWNYYDSNSDGTDDAYFGYTYVSFEDYNGSNWLTSSSSGYESNKTKLEDTYGYIALSFSLPNSGYYKYLGVSSSAKNPYLQLIGIQTSTSGTASSSSGLCDYFYYNRTESYVFGVLSGGSVSHDAVAGAFCFDVYETLTNSYDDIGFRSSLIS